MTQSKPFTTHDSRLTLRIGTRASKLARKQAEMVAHALKAAEDGLECEIVAMTTAGDRELHKQLSDWGYKGLFTKEIEDKLLANEIDIAVHSMKDMPSLLPEGLHIAGMLERADVRDAWISPHFTSIREMPEASTVGCSSARRIAQLLHIRPDVKVIPLRGNVETRLRKVNEGEADATFLAAAGLARLGLEEHIRSYIPVEEMLPAVAQGAIGIECRKSDEATRTLVEKISHTPTMHCLAAERAFLQVLDGSCRTPIAGLATLQGDSMLLRGEVLSLDGTISHQHSLTAPIADAVRMGDMLGQELRARAGKELLNHG